MKKWLSMLLVAVLTGTLVACSGGAGNNSATEAGTSAGTGQNQDENQPAKRPKVRMFISDHNLPVPTGETMEDPTFKYLADQAGIDLEVVFLPHGEYQNQVQVKYAAGDIPDVVQSWDVDPHLAANDMVVPLNDLIDQYGPNLKKYIPQESWDAVTINGQIMGIPQTPPGNAPGERVIYVRKDWMDKVGITEIPKTTEEFKQMLIAFRDGDPNGNGKKDEIPLTARESFSWMNNIFGMFGAEPYSWNFVDGELRPGYVTPQFKKALAYIKELYEEGLLDSEFITNPRNVWEQKMQNDTSGVWVHVTDLAWDWQEKLNNSIPDKNPEVIAIPTPKDPEYDGPVGARQKPTGKVYTITTKAEDPAAIVKMFDFLASEEGQAFAMLGIPGVTQQKEGDTYTYDKAKDEEDQTAAWRFTMLGIISYNADLLKVQLQNDAAVEKLDATYNLARAEGIPNYLSGAPVFDSLRENPDLGGDGAMWKEYAAQIVIGGASPDIYDQFIDEWMAVGGREILNEVNEWYNNR